MAPPRSHDADGPVDVTEAAYHRICEEIAQVQGVINVAEARLVELTRQGLEVGVSGGDDLPPAAWLAWRAGIAPERATGIVRLAKRAGELPCTIAALSAGELTVDQAAVLAQHVPARFDESAARVAQCCTVKQLRKALPHYRDRKPKADGDPEEKGSVSTGYGARGYWARIRLPEAQGALLDQALKSAREDLRRQARADALDGVEPVPVTDGDVIAAIAEAWLAAGQAARPGTDRYLVHAHLEAGPGGPQLMTHLGIVVPDGQRRHLLCDARLRGVLHDAETGAPLNAGRMTRVIGRRLRRAVEHRDGGCCTAPGCGRTTGLEIHHIVHWEDGGATDTWNLITLCWYHHDRHHHGTLGIEGNADLPRHTAPGVTFTDRWGHPLDPTGTPVRPAPPSPGAAPGDHAQAAAAAAGIAPHRYVPPTGERLDSWGFHLQEHTEPTGPTDVPLDDDGDDPPPPGITGQRPNATPPDPKTPASGAPTDPTRAGPDAA